MLVTNTKDFATVINRATHRKAMRLALTVFNGVKNLSPVDTGAFKAAWKISTGSVNGPEMSPGPSGFFDVDSTSLASTGFRASGTKYPTLFISNPKKYGPALENGHSKQAPRGMVAITLAGIRK